MLLAARDLTKQFGGVTVLSGVSIELEPGEIRALVGENGAGKSTLIKIVSGAVAPERGAVFLNDVRLPHGDPRATRNRGISIVYQELTLVQDLSVAENVFLGRELGAPLLQTAEMRRQAGRILQDLGVSLDPAALVRGLSVARQQMVEIARALSMDARVLILDEPSATLSPADVASLFLVLRRLQQRGLAIIYVSHRLEEVFQLADTVTVLRDGCHVITTRTSTLTRETLIRHMVGRDITAEFPPRSSTPGTAVLQVDHLSSPPRLADASYEVKRGEIVGLAGLVGSGRTSAAMATMGALESRGHIAVNGRVRRFRGPAEAIAAGVAYVTEDRKGHGLFPTMGLDENITVTHLSRLCRLGLLSMRRHRARAADAVRDFDIRASSLSQRAGTLSGGNQQKALLARFLLEPPHVLIVDEPTRGVDVGARSEIYGILNRLTDRGLAILMISSDLPEVMGMSDRVVVMREGRTTGELARRDVTAERIMALAAPN
ncbi:MAG: sugar ABC transporter ATP-binding protein [Vicinamibacterales bacterium]